MRRKLSLACNHKTVGANIGNLRDVALEVFAELISHLYTDWVCLISVPYLILTLRLFSRFCIKIGLKSQVFTDSSNGNLVNCRNIFILYSTLLLRLFLHWKTHLLAHRTHTKHICSINQTNFTLIYRQNEAISTFYLLGFGAVTFEPL